MRHLVAQTQCLRSVMIRTNEIGSIGVMSSSALAFDGSSFSRDDRSPGEPARMRPSFNPDPGFRREPPRTRWQRFLSGRLRAVRKAWRRFQRWRWSV